MPRRRGSGRSGWECNKRPQLCHRGLPSLSTFRGMQKHFTLHCKLLHIQQSHLSSPILQCISRLLFEIGEYYHVSFLGWKNMAPLMLTLFSNGKRPLVTKHDFRNIAHSKISKTTVHHPLDSFLHHFVLCLPCSKSWHLFLSVTATFW